MDDKGKITMRISIPNLKMIKIFILFTIIDLKLENIDVGSTFYNHDFE